MATKRMAGQTTLAHKTTTVLEEVGAHLDIME